jgi:phage-related protein
MSGKIKDFYSALKTVLSDPTTISSWMKSVETKVINGPLRKIREFLTYLKEQMDNWDMPDFVKVVDNILNSINSLIKKVYSYDGWKGALLTTGLGLTIKWIWDKVGDLVDNGINTIKSFMVGGGKGVKLEEFTSWFKNVVVGRFVDLIKDKFGSFMTSITSSLTGIGAFVDWAKKAFDGLKFVLDTFGSAVYRFTRRQNRKVGEKIGGIQL